MSSRTELYALQAERAHKRTLLWVILAVAALGMVGTYYAWATPKTIEVHLAPDMQAGDTVRVSAGVSPVPDPNVYGFAYYVWQQVNRWQDDGASDYGKQIFRFQSYITPSCRAQLLTDMQRRGDAGELKNRTRSMTEIPGLGYSEARVIQDGASAWTVLLDMQLAETSRGSKVKDTFIRYPIRVVRYDVDRQRNPWRLAIDCYGRNRPARLDDAMVRAVSDGSASVQLPSSVAPVALPDASDEVLDPTTTPAPTPLRGSADEHNPNSGSTDAADND